MKKTWLTAACAAAGLCVAMAGCQLAALAGKGSQEALFKIKKEQRVLVLVDAMEAVSVPPGFDTALGQLLNQHLYAYKATDHIVAQERLLQLKDEKKDAYKKMSIEDIATATDADLVISVFVTRLSTPVTTDGTVGQADALVMVKVVDRNGNRLFPGDQGGVPIMAKEDPALTSDRNMEKTLQGLLVQLTRRTGRMFHKYSLDDKTLLR
jgi:hypothetical protein